MAPRNKKLTRLRKLSHDDLPATVGLVKQVRNELRADIRGLEHRMNAKFEGQDARFEGQDSRFEEIIKGLHQVQVIVEEQRSENRIVLDGIKTMIDRQDRFDVELKELKDVRTQSP